MRWIKILGVALGLAGLLLWPLFAFGQDCKNGVCVPPATYSWTIDGDQATLWFGNTQIGAYRAGVYRDYRKSQNAWSSPRAWPAVAGDPPAPKRVAKKDATETPVNAVFNFGVDLEKIAPPKAEPTYTYKGFEVSRDVAKSAVVEKTLPDDTGKPWLTVIGSDADRKRVVDDLPAELKANVKLNSYRPDHWAVTPGFVTSGSPTIYLQSPDGKVVHRQDSYGGPKDFESIRKKVADYDPKRDPNLQLPASTPIKLPAFLTLQNLILGGLFVAVAVLFKQQRKVAT